jgi:broad specificity phosphatase PhoE
MRKLLLIKHAAPLIDPTIASHHWTLSEAGKASCTGLAREVAKHAPARLFSSVEPKAHETAALLADALSLPLETRDGLREHNRSNVPHMRTSDFISSVELFFRKRSDRVLGLESAAECLQRFEQAVNGVLDSSGEQSTAIVAHGTVISLYLADRSQTSAFEIWRQMKLPSFAVVDADHDQVVEIVYRID